MSILMLVYKVKGDQTNAIHAFRWQYDSYILRRYMYIYIYIYNPLWDILVYITSPE